MIFICCYFNHIWSFELRTHCSLRHASLWTSLMVGFRIGLCISLCTRISSPDLTLPLDYQQASLSSYFGAFVISLYCFTHLYLNHQMKMYFTFQHYCSRLPLTVLLLLWTWPYCVRVFTVNFKLKTGLVISKAGRQTDSSESVASKRSPPGRVV